MGRLDRTQRPLARGTGGPDERRRRWSRPGQAAKTLPRTASALRRDRPGVGSPGPRGGSGAEGYGVRAKTHLPRLPAPRDSPGERRGRGPPRRAEGGSSLPVDQTGPNPPGLDRTVVLSPKQRDCHQPDRGKTSRTPQCLDSQRRRPGLFGCHEVGDLGVEGPANPVAQGNDPERASAMSREPGKELGSSPPVRLDPLPVRFGVPAKVVGGRQSHPEFSAEPVRRRQEALVPAVEPVEGSSEGHDPMPGPSPGIRSGRSSPERAGR